MKSIKEYEPYDNQASSSRAIQYLGVRIYSYEGEPLKGEHVLKDKTIARFVDGFLDGNVYNEKGEVIERRAALEYELGGLEYWTKGFPEGSPAISQAWGVIEEDWHNGKILRIRNEMELTEIN